MTARFMYLIRSLTFDPFGRGMHDGGISSPIAATLHRILGMAAAFVSREAGLSGSIWQPAILRAANFIDVCGAPGSARTKTERRDGATTVVGARADTYTRREDADPMESRGCRPSDGPLVFGSP